MLKKVLIGLLISASLFATEYSLKVDDRVECSVITEVDSSDFWEDVLVVEEYHYREAYDISRLIVSDSAGTVCIDDWEYDGVIQEHGGRIVFLPDDMELESGGVRSIVFYFYTPYFKYFIEMENENISEGPRFDEYLKMSNSRFSKVVFNKYFVWDGTFVKE